MVDAIYKNGMHLPNGEPGEVIKIEPPDYITMIADREDRTTLLPCKRQYTELKY